jgi:hypothetical protein
MGNSSYSSDSRKLRATGSGFYTKSADQIFTQSRERKAHSSMKPQGITFRESRDSETHPNTVPIILGLDVTGSMSDIPHELIKDGLPTLMGKVIQNGTPDASLLFLAIGDHECDNEPLQVGQFESGDAELDMWLTRTYLEGNGGGNGGESYLLAWYFAGHHTQTDAWDKRKEKGYLITVGDEPGLKSLPSSAVKELMGANTSERSVFRDEELLLLAQQRYDVYHIHCSHNGARPKPQYWDILGNKCIVCEDHKEVPIVIANIINRPKQHVSASQTSTSSSPSKTPPEIIL